MNLDDLSLESVQVNEFKLDEILGGIPDASVNANSLSHTKETTQEASNDIDFSQSDSLDLNSILSKIEDQDEDENKEDKEKDQVETKVETKVEEKEKPSTKVSTKETKELNEEALKEITNFYIGKGLWKDFDGKDEIEYTPEVFQEILEKQNEEIAKEKFQELVDSTGDIGKSIINYITNGGKPDDIIDLFKEQKENTQFVSDSVEDKKQYIAEYYKNVHGFSNEKIKKIINSAEVDDTLDEEVTEIKSSYEKYYSKELKRIDEEREEYVTNQKVAEEKFQTDITQEITARADLSPKEKQALQDVLLKYDQKLSDGTKVNKFYLKFAEMQNSIKDYVDFALFVTEKEKYLNKISKKEETKATEKAWFKIKQNGSIDNKTGSSSMKVQASKDVEEFNWGFK